MCQVDQVDRLADGPLILRAQSKITASELCSAEKQRANLEVLETLEVLEALKEDLWTYGLWDEEPLRP